MEIKKKKKYEKPRVLAHGKVKDVTMVIAASPI